MVNSQGSAPDYIDKIIQDMPEGKSLVFELYRKITQSLLATENLTTAEELNIVLTVYEVRLSALRTFDTYEGKQRDVTTDAIGIAFGTFQDEYSSQVEQHLKRLREVFTESLIGIELPEDITIAALPQTFKIEMALKMNRDIIPSIIKELREDKDFSITKNSLLLRFKWGVLKKEYYEYMIQRLSDKLFDMGYWVRQNSDQLHVYKKASILEVSSTGEREKKVIYYNAFQKTVLKHSPFNKGVFRYDPKTTSSDYVESAKFLKDSKINYTGPFINGFALVRRGGQYNYISSLSYKLYFKDWIRFAEEFREGLAVIGVEGGYNFMNTEGKFLFDEPFDNILHSNSDVRIVKRGCLYNFVDQGKLLSSKWFNELGEFRDGVALVKFENSFNYISKAGELMNKKKFAWASPFKDGIGIVKGFEYGTKFFLDVTGKSLANTDFLESYQRQNGSIRLKFSRISGDWEIVINRDGIVN